MSSTLNDRKMLLASMKSFNMKSFRSKQKERPFPQISESIVRKMLQKGAQARWCVSVLIQECVFET